MPHTFLNGEEFLFINDLLNEPGGYFTMMDVYKKDIHSTHPLFFTEISKERREEFVHYLLEDGNLVIEKLLDGNRALKVNKNIIDVVDTTIEDESEAPYKWIKHKFEVERKKTKKVKSFFSKK